MAGLLATGATLYAQMTTPVPSLPGVYILAPDATALSGTSSGAFTIIRNDTNGTLNVALTITGTASNGVDYVQIPNPVTIPDGFLAVDIPVQPIANPDDTRDKTVVVTIDTNADYHIVPGLRRATVEIVADNFNVPRPTVDITSPPNGSVFQLPTTVTVTAEAGDPGSPIKSVSFFANAEFLGQATNSPYSVTWTPKHAGAYSLLALAVDEVGQSTLSTPVHVTAVDIDPIVKITSPANGQNFIAGQNISIQSTAVDPEEPIVSVDFYANGHAIGTVTNAPYNLIWQDVPAGLYRLNAVATAQSGDKGYSNLVRINVSTPSGPSGPGI